MERSEICQSRHGRAQRCLLLFWVYMAGPMLRASAPWWWLYLWSSVFAVVLVAVLAYDYGASAQLPEP